jgi:hypothetical protein
MNFETLAPGLTTLTRRATEITPDNMTGWFTEWRRIELSTELDGTTSVWTIGKPMVAGRVVETTVLVGTLFDEAKLPRVLQKAKSLLAEVLLQGSRIAVLLGECRTRGGNRVLAYYASDLDPSMADARFETFIARHGLIVVLICVRELLEASPETVEEAHKLLKRTWPRIDYATADLAFAHYLDASTPHEPAPSLPVVVTPIGGGRVLGITERT